MAARWPEDREPAERQTRTGRTSSRSSSSRRAERVEMPLASFQQAPAAAEACVPEQTGSRRHPAERVPSSADSNIEAASQSSAEQSRRQRPPDFSISPQQPSFPSSYPPSPVDSMHFARPPGAGSSSQQSLTSSPLQETFESGSDPSAQIGRCGQAREDALSNSPLQPAFESVDTMLNRRRNSRDLSTSPMQQAFERARNRPKDVSDEPLQPMFEGARRGSRDLSSSPLQPTFESARRGSRDFSNSPLQPTFDDRLLMRRRSRELPSSPLQSTVGGSNKQASGPGGRRLSRELSESPLQQFFETLSAAGDGPEAGGQSGADVEESRLESIDPEQFDWTGTVLQASECAQLLAGENEACRVENGRLRKQVEDMKQACKAGEKAASELEQYKVENSKLSAQIMQLQTDNDRLQQDVAAQQQEIENLHLECSYARAEAQELATRLHGQQQASAAAAKSSRPEGAEMREWLQILEEEVQESYAHVRSAEQHTARVTVEKTKLLEHAESVEEAHEMRQTDLEKELKQVRKELQEARAPPLRESLRSGGRLDAEAAASPSAQSFQSFRVEASQRSSPSGSETSFPREGREPAPLRASHWRSEASRAEASERAMAQRLQLELRYNEQLHEHFNELEIEDARRSSKEEHVEGRPPVHILWQECEELRSELRSLSGRDESQRQLHRRTEKAIEESEARTGMVCQELHSQRAVLEGTIVSLRAKLADSERSELEKESEMATVLAAEVDAQRAAEDYEVQLRQLRSEGRRVREVASTVEDAQREAELLVRHESSEIAQLSAALDAAREECRAEAVATGRAVGMAQETEFGLQSVETQMQRLQLNLEAAECAEQQFEILYQQKRADVEETLARLSGEHELVLLAKQRDLEAVKSAYRASEEAADERVSELQAECETHQEAAKRAGRLEQQLAALLHQEHVDSRQLSEELLEQERRNFALLQQVKEAGEGEESALQEELRSLEEVCQELRFSLDTAVLNFSQERDEAQRLTEELVEQEQNRSREPSCDELGAADRNLLEAKLANLEVVCQELKTSTQRPAEEPKQQEQIKALKSEVSKYMTLLLASEAEEHSSKQQLGSLKGELDELMVRDIGRVDELRSCRTEARRYMTALLASETDEKNSEHALADAVGEMEALRIRLADAERQFAEDCQELQDSSGRDNSRLVSECSLLEGLLQTAEELLQDKIDDNEELRYQETEVHTVAHTENTALEQSVRREQELSIQQHELSTAEQGESMKHLRELQACLEEEGQQLRAREASIEVLEQSLSQERAGNKKVTEALEVHLDAVRLEVSQAASSGRLQCEHMEAQLRKVEDEATAAASLHAAQEATLQDKVQELVEARRQYLATEANEEAARRQATSASQPAAQELEGGSAQPADDVLQGLEDKAASFANESKELKGLLQATEKEAAAVASKYAVEEANWTSQVLELTTELKAHQTAHAQATGAAAPDAEKSVKQPDHEQENLERKVLVLEEQGRHMEAQLRAAEEAAASMAGACAQREATLRAEMEILAASEERSAAMQKLEQEAEGDKSNALLQCQRTEEEVRRACAEEVMRVQFEMAQAQEEAESSKLALVARLSREEDIESERASQALRITGELEGKYNELEEHAATTLKMAHRRRDELAQETAVAESLKHAIAEAKMAQSEITAAASAALESVHSNLNERMQRLLDENVSESKAAEVCKQEESRLAQEVTILQDEAKASEGQKAMLHVAVEEKATVVSRLELLSRASEEELAALRAEVADAKDRASTLQEESRRSQEAAQRDRASIDVHLTNAIEEARRADQTAKAREASLVGESKKLEEELRRMRASQHDMQHELDQATSETLQVESKLQSERSEASEKLDEVVRSQMHCQALEEQVSLEVAAVREAHLASVRSLEGEMQKTRRQWMDKFESEERETGRHLEASLLQECEALKDRAASAEEEWRQVRVETKLALGRYENEIRTLRDECSRSKQTSPPERRSASDGEDRAHDELGTEVPPAGIRGPVAPIDLETPGAATLNFRAESERLRDVARHAQSSLQRHRSEVAKQMQGQQLERWALEQECELLRSELACAPRAAAATEFVHEEAEHEIHRLRRACMRLQGIEIQSNSKVEQELEISRQLKSECEHWKSRSQSLAGVAATQELLEEEFGGAEAALQEERCLNAELLSESQRLRKATVHDDAVVATATPPRQDPLRADGLRQERTLSRLATPEEPSAMEEDVAVDPSADQGILCLDLQRAGDPETYRYQVQRLHESLQGECERLRSQAGAQLTALVRDLDTMTSVVLASQVSSADDFPAVQIYSPRSQLSQTGQLSPSSRTSPPASPSRVLQYQQLKQQHAECSQLRDELRLLQEQASIFEKEHDAREVALQASETTCESLSGSLAKCENAESQMQEEITSLRAELRLQVQEQQAERAEDQGMVVEMHKLLKDGMDSFVNLQHTHLNIQNRHANAELRAEHQEAVDSGEITVLQFEYEQMKRTLRQLEDKHETAAFATLTEVMQCESERDAYMAQAEKYAEQNTSLRRHCEELLQHAEEGLNAEKAAAASRARGHIAATQRASPPRTIQAMPSRLRPPWRRYRPGGVLLRAS
eukprot:TRINITY_DN38315_c0_g1_i2.p1 TRINITY_DN38315_c0_g1~~TRINITY_DN38315_c0_g1_i2.p1  ORF type:complete len:2592 (+),score=706.54 TRINITY_DN38315_c0_g1_i2:201-7976(+)